MTKALELVEVRTTHGERGRGRWTDGELSPPEEWRPTRVAGLEVSNLGRVRSRRARNGRRLPAGEWRICAQSIQRSRRRDTLEERYAVVGIGGRLTELVHVLVLEGFVGPRPRGMECRHLDGDKLNNRLHNLAWGSPNENAADRARHGTVTGQKLTVPTARALKRRLAAGDRLTDLAREFDVPYKTVQNLHAGRTWKWLDAEVE